MDLGNREWYHRSAGVKTKKLRKESLKTKKHLSKKSTKKEKIFKKNPKEKKLILNKFLTKNISRKYKKKYWVVISHTNVPGIFNSDSDKSR